MMEQSQQPSSQPSSQNASGQHQPEQPDEEKSRLQKAKDKLLPGVRITLLISLIFYIAMFCVGIWGVPKCPVEEYIPFFLIVTGCIGLVSKAISVIRESLLRHYQIQYAESSFYTAELVFLILGSYWVFKEYKPSFNPLDKTRYCNKTVYMFAFIYLAVLYSIILLMLLGFCCFIGCIFFVKQTENTNNQDPESQTRPIRVSSSESDQQS